MYNPIKKELKQFKVVHFKAWNYKNTCFLNVSNVVFDKISINLRHTVFEMANKYKTFLTLVEIQLKNRSRFERFERFYRRLRFIR